MQSVAKGRSLQTSTDQGKKLRQVVCSEARDWTIRQTPKAITGLQIKTSAKLQAESQIYTTASPCLLDQFQENPRKESTNKLFFF